MARTFEQVWEKSGVIYGAFDREELYRLYSLADSCGPQAVFVEIGSYCGRSSSALGMVAADNNCSLTCVDSFVTGQPNEENVQDTFLENMKKVGAKFELLYEESADAAKLFKKPIDLLLIDGDHSYEGIKTDCELWIPKVKSGGWVLFHDYLSSWTDVRKVVDGLSGLEDNGLTLSLAVRRKQ